MRHYVVTINQEYKVEEFLVESVSPVSAIRSVTDGMVTARIATVEDAIRLSSSGRIGKYIDETGVNFEAEKTEAEKAEVEKTEVA